MKKKVVIIHNQYEEYVEMPAAIFNDALASDGAARLYGVLCISTACNRGKDVYNHIDMECFSPEMLKHLEELQADGYIVLEDVELQVDDDDMATIPF